MFFNSLRLTWQMSLWVDSAVLLRTMAWLDTPPEDALLTGLLPRQLELDYPLKNEPQPNYPIFPAIPHFHQITFGTPSMNTTAVKTRRIFDETFKREAIQN